MTKYQCENFESSLSCAKRGLVLLYKSQKNLKIQIVTGLFSIIFATVLSFSPIEYIILFLLIFIVLTAEMINSVLEFMLDSIFKNNYSELVRMAKDMSAGVVLFSSFCAAAIGAVLFINRLVWFFSVESLFI